MSTTLELVGCVFVIVTHYFYVYTQNIRPALHTIAEHGEASFVVFIKTAPTSSDPDEKTNDCTGTIIDRNWVLTAASCIPGRFAKQYNITVMANVYSYDAPKNDTQIRQVADVFIHPMYRQDVLAQADLALLYLQLPLDMNENVQAVNIDPEPWPWENNLPARQPCNVIGFGGIDYTKYDTQLKIRQVEAFHADTCPCCRRQQWMHLICLDSMEDVGLCPIDLGAPLICKEKLVGINHQLVVRKNCTKSLFPMDICGDYSVTSYFMYICPYMGWIRERVSGTPAQPQSCDLSTSTRALPPIYVCMLLFLIYLQ